LKMKRDKRLYIPNKLILTKDEQIPIGSH
jgi:hypothetical protein